jgi:hypothetical protein
MGRRGDWGMRGCGDDCEKQTQNCQTKPTMISIESYQFFPLAN